VDRKRILLIFAGAWISAAALTWFLYRSTRAPRVEKTVTILAATRDLPAGTRLQTGDLKRVRVFEAEAPKSAVVEEAQILNRALLFPVSANEPLTTPKISGTSGAEGLPATIEIGKRAIAVPINDASGVAGLIQPRAHVDVLFTRTGSPAEAITTIILEDVIVLAIGRTTEATSSASPASATAQVAARPSAQSATLLVTPDQARTLELAKNQGKISLALRNPLDRGTVARGATRAQALYPPGSAPGVRTAAAPPKAEPPPPPPEPPPKPKRLVDIYRGDKHIQEAF
jgi:pilus assembly protein CpaB